jgi:hypothetical protein
MLTRTYVGAALACSAVFLVGCGNGAAPEPSPPPTPAEVEKSPPTVKPAPTGAEVVTLHVKGMVERLKLI